MSLYNLFDVNKELETDGFLLDLVDPDGDVHYVFKIARAGGANRKFTKRLQQLLKPHQYAFDRGTMDPETQDKIFVRAISEHIVLGWENINDPSGEPIPYSVDACANLLESLPELREMIYTEANNISNFIDQERVQSAKNSQTSSTGNSEEVRKPSKSTKQQ